jgi:hypothetical protein
MPFTGLVMQPQELDLVQGVFKAIIAEPWFHRSTTHEKEFAAFIIRTFREGLTDRERLMSYSRLVAREWFSTWPPLD